MVSALIGVLHVYQREILKNMEGSNHFVMLLYVYLEQKNQMSSRYGTGGRDAKENILLFSTLTTMCNWCIMYQLAKGVPLTILYDNTPRHLWGSSSNAERRLKYFSLLA